MLKPNFANTHKYGQNDEISMLNNATLIIKD